ncbi:MAG: outer membrane receptor protein involved in Fe transport [Gammaproteobacteria bacterium]|jgi:outer membrane receptor protein involved in Fe transport
MTLNPVPYLRFIVLAAALSVASISGALTAPREVDEQTLKLHELSFEQLLKTKIITSTRNSIDIAQSPTSATVYTSADIKRMGVRNIKELLERTPGFFTNKQPAGPAIGSRGFIGDNEQFLLLIDGHNANSIVDKGPGNFFVYPMLENVKRVEILRGPGSTLWGSDAALGIIHIITEDGSELDKSTITYSQASEDDYRFLNLKIGEKITQNVDYLASLTFSESSGFVLDPRDFLAREGMWEDIDDSWELYLKANLDNVKVYARVSDFTNARPGGSVSGVDEDAYTRRRHTYLDIQRNWQLNTRADLELRVFSDLMERWHAVITPITSPGTAIVEDSGASRELSLGVELISRMEPIKGHNLLAGLRAVKTEVDPVTFARIFPVTAEPSSSPITNNNKVVPDEVDKNFALFIEDDWKINNELSMVLGVRLDRNTLREESTIVLPRFSVNWNFSPSWFAQYSYTTGYIRPPVGLGFLGQGQFNTGLTFSAEGKLYGAADSQEVKNHELRVSYKREPLSFSISFYKTAIENSFNFIFEPASVGGEDGILAFVNTPRVDSQGTEIEFNYVPSSSWNLYGNLSLVFDASIDEFTGKSFGAEFDLDNTAFGFGEGIFTGDGSVVGYPEKILNLGVNYFYDERISANLHYRVWSDLKTRNRIDLFTVGKGEKSYGPEQFLDLNIRFGQVMGYNLDASLFVKNILNNDDSKIGMLYFTQDWTERARSIGFNISYAY